MRGVGDTESRQLFRANLCFLNVLVSLKFGANSIREMMCEGNRAGQSATSKKQKPPRPRQSDSGSCVPFLPFWYLS